MLGLKRVLFEKIALEGQFESHCSQLDGRRRYCISYSTRVQEIKDYGQPDSHKLPTDEGHGYIWRLYSLTKFEERDGGVYIEVEAIALSRDISASLRWFTKPSAYPEIRCPQSSNLLGRRCGPTSQLVSICKVIAHVSVAFFTKSKPVSEGIDGRSLLRADE
jgi:hypothetical protein